MGRRLARPHLHHHHPAPADNNPAPSTWQQAIADASTAGASARAPFQWVDGPLVTAMRNGDMILVDEINLAEDAVLERLNRWAASWQLLCSF
jgi:midasin (ATPase involved in ribosome maturation)